MIVDDGKPNKPLKHFLINLFDVFLTVFYTICKGDNQNIWK